MKSISDFLSCFFFFAAVIEWSDDADGGGGDGGGSAPPPPPPPPPPPSARAGSGGDIAIAISSPARAATLMANLLMSFSCWLADPRNPLARTPASREHSGTRR